MFHLLRTTALWLISIVIIAGQQLEGAYEPYELLGLSPLEPSFELVPQEPLEALWRLRASGLSDLTQLRTEIHDACNDPSDVLGPESVAYPATFIVDRWLYAIESSCLKDPSSGNYCDTIVSSWTSSGAEYTAEQNCSCCELGLLQKQIASPFGYFEEEAEEFSFLNSSCSVATYTYATPTAICSLYNPPYTHNIYAYIPVPVTQSPLKPHAPGTLDDCDVYVNPFEIPDDGLVDMAACQAWGDKANVKLAKFVEWNPSLSVENCTMDLNYSYCIGRTGTTRWGFALHLCTYKDDTQWKRMLDPIQTEVLFSLEAEERMDLLPSLQLTITDDPTEFGGATFHDIREHFKLWTQDVLVSVLKDPAKRTFDVLGGNGRERRPLELEIGARYNFCLFVNETCLESLDELPDRPMVKILSILRGRSQPEQKVYKVHPGFEEGQTDQTDEDVG
ncbi:hypothetical protein BDV12DRAFT_202644 [Aspergillus spectabilis]